MRLILLTQVLTLSALVYAHSALCSPNAGKVTQPMLLLTEKDEGRTVDIRVGQELRISLPENATTGYRWATEHYPEEFIETIAIEPRYTANAVGSGGLVAFVFRGAKVGSGEIVLKHWRHWEGERSITRRFRLRVNVR